MRLVNGLAPFIKKNPSGIRFFYFFLEILQYINCTGG